MEMIGLEGDFEVVWGVGRYWEATSVKGDVESGTKMKGSGEVLKS